MNNLNLIIGDNNELIDFHLKNILDNLEYQEENKIIYDMNINNLNDILDESSMISLFGNIKIIIGNNFDISKLKEDNINYLEKYLSNINKNSYIILIASKIDARVKAYKLIKDKFNIIDTNKDNVGKSIEIYVKNKLKGYKIESYVLEYLINKLGQDINNIDLELNKLLIYKEDSKLINKEDIDLLIFDNIDNIIYEFTNAVLEEDIDKVSKMYDDFTKQNIGFDYLISTLSNTFRQALIIKMMHNDNNSNLEISKIIGKKEFYVKKMLERIYKYSEKDLSKMITKLADIDYKYKSGESNYDILKLFLININK